MKPQGCLLTGPNGNRIFLPANGYLRESASNELKGIVGKYWSASSRDNTKAWSLEIKESNSEKKEAYFAVKLEERCYGISIRPVLSAPSISTEPKRPRRMIIVDELPYMQNSDSPWWSWEPDNHMEGWDVAIPELPVNPVEALEQLRSLCNQTKPDILVSTGSSTLLCKQLSEYRRICLLSKEPPSELLCKLEKSDKFHQGTEISDDLIEQYRKMEDNTRAMCSDEDCWVVYTDMNDSVREEFSGWDFVKYPKLNTPERWRVTFLFPFIRNIFENK